MVIVSIEPHEVPTTFSRPRQVSDELNKNGEMGAVEDTMLEEPTWDCHQKKTPRREVGCATMEECRPGMGARLPIETLPPLKRCFVFRSSLENLFLKVNFSWLVLY